MPVAIAITKPVRVLRSTIYLTSCAPTPPNKNTPGPKQASKRRKHKPNTNKQPQAQKQKQPQTQHIQITQSLINPSQRYLMAEDKPPAKLNVPRLRVSSHSFNDTSYNSLPNVSQRTVSSSTSLLSTPSNNIRRVQQQMNAQGRNAQGRNGLPSRSRQKPPDVCISGISSTAAASRKLLNLQQSKKTSAKPRPFVLRKPAVMTKYDYSVFVGSHQDAEAGDVSDPPLVKQSQVRAWESAEKISGEIIFEKDSSLPNDTVDTFNESPSGHSVDEDFFPGDDIHDKTEALVGRPNLLESIPQYTKGELKVIFKNFDKLRTCTSAPDYYEVEDSEKKELWLYRQQQNVTQERAFTANHSLLGKRKVQVFHKKEFLHKLFGYSNNINQECITNNTSYSACDNVFNAQKAFHEDKEEILGLLSEDKAFEEELKVTKENLMATISDSAVTSAPKKKVFDQTMDQSDLLDLTNSWLTSSYEKQTGACTQEDESEIEPGDHPEVLAFTIGLLKQRVKEAYDEPTETPVY
ncbi:hypothetical protein JCM33374_g2721 [Metschnikowia sp. JCM 33374]|nr:hypothetical protein JCM33374_g2721 [Metschnikowia sp. JCM 33374]